MTAPGGSPLAPSVPATSGVVRRLPLGGSGRHGSWIWLQGLACGALLVLATPTAVLGAALLAPGLLALLLDRAPGRPVARAVLLFGLAAGARPMLQLWQGPGSAETALRIAADPAVLGLAWIAQSAGWLLGQLLPVLIRVSTETAATARITRLRARRAELEQVWGLPPVAGRAATAPATPPGGSVQRP